ncbi:MAG: hypothetical protein KDD43_00960, partial [Bdellovibrionales bacterium]|nr:hypothetical protein [Bdellovibrionales bacterium]
MIGCLSGTPFQLLAPPQAYGAESASSSTRASQCPGFLRRTGSAMAQYWREVKETKGVRIILTDGRPEDLAHIEYAGFLTRNAKYIAQGRTRRFFQNILQFVPRRAIGGLRGERGRVRGALLGDPSFSFTPWRGLHFVALDLPAAYFGGLK